MKIKIEVKDVAELEALFGVLESQLFFSPTAIESRVKVEVEKPPAKPKVEKPKAEKPKIEKPPAKSKAEKPKEAKKKPAPKPETEKKSETTEVGDSDSEKISDSDKEALRRKLILLANTKAPHVPKDLLRKFGYENISAIEDQAAYDKFVAAVDERQKED